MQERSLFFQVFLLNLEQLSFILDFESSILSFREQIFTLKRSNHGCRGNQLQLLPWERHVFTFSNRRNLLKFKALQLAESSYD
jgi:hypothetical protein